MVILQGTNRETAPSRRLRCSRTPLPPYPSSRQACRKMRTHRAGGPSSFPAVARLGVLLLGVQSAAGLFYLPGVAPKSYSKADPVRDMLSGLSGGNASLLSWSDLRSRAACHCRCAGEAICQQADLHQDADPLRLLLPALLPPQQDSGKRHLRHKDVRHELWLTSRRISGCLPVCVC